MNCFHHDNDHWKTAPQWTAGPFCFCMNANNNTYSCVRTINSTHNFLYCEFTTGMVTFYNLRVGQYRTFLMVYALYGGSKSQCCHCLNYCSYIADSVPQILPVINFTNYQKVYCQPPFK